MKRFVYYWLVGIVILAVVIGSIILIAISPYKVPILAGIMFLLISAVIGHGIMDGKDHPNDI